jgi:hypothetical protein
MEKNYRKICVIIGTLFTFIVMSCDGNGQVIKSVKTGVFTYNPTVTVEEAIKTYPYKKDGIAWKVENVVEQSKKQGGNIYLVTATFNHDTNEMALFSRDGMPVSVKDQNNFLNMILIHSDGDLSGTNFTTDEKILNILDAYADIYHDENGMPKKDETISEQKYFSVDSLQVKLQFACAPETGELELLSGIYAYKISAKELGVSETITGLLEIPNNPFGRGILEIIYDDLSPLDVYGYVAMVTTERWREAMQETVREKEEAERALLEAPYREIYEHEKQQALEIIDRRIQYFSQSQFQRTRDYSPSIEPYSGANIIDIEVMLADFETEKQDIIEDEFSLSKFFKEEGDELYISSGTYKLIQYYNTTPFDELVPRSENSPLRSGQHMVNRITSRIKQNYQALSEAKGGYYKIRQ